MGNIKLVIRTSIGILLLCYLVASIVESDFWGNLLSPIVTLVFFFIVFKAFFINQKTISNRLSGFCLSMSLLVWAVSDILWAICDLILHTDPEEVDLITYGYAATNLFLVLALTIYTLQSFRKWNIIQIILDSTVISYLIVQLIWVVFLEEDVKKIVQLRSDWVTTTSIILDILIVIWAAIWYLSIREGRVPLYLRFMIAGAFLYVITDLIYFYECIYRTYDPNTLLDLAYIMSFGLFAIAALLRMNDNDSKINRVFHNTGQKGKGFYLLAAPIILFIFEGIMITYLLQFVTIILLYYMISNYIQNNIYNERLLRREKEQNSILELKVKERTEELEGNNRVLQHLIDQDYITGLYNRRYLMKYLEHEIGRLKDKETIILLYIDINRYKMITTMFGNYIGEKILMDMASRLKPMERLAERSILATYGDDTYIFAAVGLYNYQDGHVFAEEAIKLCSDIYHIVDYQIRVTVNIGISLFPFDALIKEDLIKHGDVAMTQARGKGFNMIHVFDLGLSEVFFRKSSIELKLKKANIQQEFMVYYQPQLLTESKKIIGFEALLRWKTYTGEFISPNEFIPVAEETGCIIPIGDWVIKTVMMQLVNWNNRFKEKIMIGINVSLKQLNSAQFAVRLKEDLDRLQVRPEWIDLEITESLQLQENPEVVKMLSDIRALGVKISMDDFGTGYSSLSYFKGLPVDRIKLAKELVDYVHKDDFDYQLVKSIIQLSKAKGIRVIAEGVETLEQWETLKELECDEVQGFFFGRPIPAQEIEQVFKDELFGMNK